MLGLKLIHFNKKSPDHGYNMGITLPQRYDTKHQLCNSNKYKWHFLVRITYPFYRFIIIYLTWKINQIPISYECHLAWFSALSVYRSRFSGKTKYTPSLTREEWGVVRDMMTSSNGNIFRIPLLLRGIHRSRMIPLTKTCDAGRWCFLWSAPEQTVE